MTRIALMTTVGGLLSVAQAQELPQVARYNLPSSLSDSSSNFHPQGLGVDEAAGELIYAQQSLRQIATGSLDGQFIRQTTGLSTSNSNHITSVAVRNGEFYYSDYTSNSSGQDMWRAAMPNASARNAYGADRKA